MVKNKKIEKPTVEEEVVSKEVVKKEDKTLIWFFIFVAIVFGAVLIPYFWAESSKSFDFGGINWMVEDYQELRIFHGRFVSLTNENLNYNLYFREDPRENDALVVGNISDFKYGGIISLSPDANNCRGELSRVMMDLGAFLMRGVGVGPIESAFNDLEFANESGKDFVTCENTLDRTVVVVNVLGDGEKRRVEKDANNPNCYTIYAEDCEDSAIVEKFMTQAVIDFREKQLE